MRKFIKKHSAVLRAIVVVGMVGAIVTSVTYASLQSQAATLTGNTIQSASANLLIGTASATSTAFSATHSGFTFSGIVPGGAASADYTFYLKNSGSATLSLKMAVGSTPTNLAGVDLTKVNINLTRVDGSPVQTFTLQALLDANAANAGLPLTDTLAPASTGYAYKMNIAMAADAFTGSSASIGAIDFVFTGSATIAN